MAKWRKKCDDCCVGWGARRNDDGESFYCALMFERVREGYEGLVLCQGFKFCPHCGVEINPEEPPHPEIEKEVNSLL